LYPDFKYFLEAVFKMPMPGFFSTIKTFGFFVAIAFLIGARLLKSELERKERSGLLQPRFLSSYSLIIRRAALPKNHNWAISSCLKDAGGDWWV
jgi:hypothetical protein